MNCVKISVNICVHISWCVLRLMLISVFILGGVKISVKSCVNCVFILNIVNIVLRLVLILVLIVC